MCCLPFRSIRGPQIRDSLFITRESFQTFLLTQMIECAWSSGDLDSVPESRRTPEEWNSNPLQYFCQESFIDRGAWRATVHWVAKSQTQLSNSQFHFTYFFTEDPLAFHPRLQKEFLSSITLFKKVNLFFRQNINEGCFICLIFAFTCTFHKCKYLSSFFFQVQFIYLFIYLEYHGLKGTYPLPYYMNLTDQMIPNIILPSMLGTGIL